MIIFDHYCNFERNVFTAKEERHLEVKTEELEMGVIEKLNFILKADTLPYIKTELS